MLLQKRYTKSFPCSPTLLVRNGQSKSRRMTFWNSCRLPFHVITDGGQNEPIHEDLMFPLPTFDEPSQSSKPCCHKLSNSHGSSPNPSRSKHSVSESQRPYNLEVMLGSQVRMTQNLLQFKGSIIEMTQRVHDSLRFAYIQSFAPRFEREMPDPICRGHCAQSKDLTVLRLSLCPTWEKGTYSSPDKLSWLSSS